MRLLVVHEGAWRLLAPLEADPGGILSCPLLEQLTGLAADYQKSVVGLAQVFKRIDKRGPIASLGKNLFHLANSNKNKKVYEFKKGDIRVYCFIAPAGAICVMSTAKIKKGQKSNPQAIKQTENLFDTYKGAMKRNAVEIYVTNSNYPNDPAAMKYVMEGKYERLNA